MFIEDDTFERKREEAELARGVMRMEYRHESNDWSNEMLQTKACLQGAETASIPHHLAHALSGGSTNC